jgi:hypothetical protein
MRANFEFPIPTVSLPKKFAGHASVTEAATLPDDPAISAETDSDQMALSLGNENAWSYTKMVSC